MKKSLIIAIIIVSVLAIGGVANAKTNFLHVLGLRIDGEIWRGPKAGTKDKTPVVVNDNLKVTGDITMGGQSLKVKLSELSAQQTCAVTCPVSPIAPSADTQLRMATMAFVACIDLAQNYPDQERVKIEIQKCRSVFVNGLGM